MSTFPSGQHLGLYKSLVTAHIDSNGEFSKATKKKEDTTKDKASAILQIIHGLALACVEHGFYLHQGIYVINVMIYKKCGELDLDKLRVIHLFKADFNMMIGLLFGRRAMWHQVDNKLLHLGQHGKPGGECQNTTLVKILHNVISHLMYTPMGQYESDATACFNRIVMQFALLCFKTNGAPMSPLQKWEQVLCKIIYRIKNTY